MKRVALAEWIAMLKAREVPREHLAVKCVACGTVQSLASFTAVGLSLDAAEKQLGFSCIGRTDRNQGCDWTLGGLFQIHKLEIVTEDGKAHPIFEPASPEEERELMARHRRASAPASEVA